MNVVMLGKYPIGEIDNGVSVHTKNIIKYLGKKNSSDINLTVISFGERSSEIYDGSANICIFNACRIYYIFPFLAILKLYIEVLKRRPDIVHLQGSNMSPYLFCLLFPLKNCSKVVTSHNIHSRELVAHGKFSKNSLIYHMIRYIEKTVLSRVDLVITVTDELNEWIKKEYSINPKKVITLSNGINEQLLSFSFDNNESEYKKDYFCIFHAKAFVSNNGQEYLIRSLSSILEVIPNVRLVLAGDGPQKKRLLDLTKNLSLCENVIFLGNIPHSKAILYIAKADIIVIPSISIDGFEEGASIFLLEAMALGKPIIASNIGGLKENIENNVNGILVPDRDTDAISKYVIKLYNNKNLSHKLGINAKEYILQNRLWCQIAEKLYLEYESLCQYFDNKPSA
jgi:glycosyltransferase involved in cell wall biosynthesis